MAQKIISEKELRQGRRNRRMFIGLLTVILVTVGIFSIVQAASGAIAKLFDDTEEREIYASLLSPIVKLDPLPFATLETSPPELFIVAGIWMSLEREDNAKFELDETGAMLLPALDVSKHIATIIGPDFAIQHKTIIDNGLEYTYREDKLCYVIPITGLNASYIVKVDKLANEGNYKRLTVGYYSPYTNAAIDGQSKGNSAVKYMDYIMLKNGKSYFLTSIQESETKPDVADTPGTDIISPGEIIIPDIEAQEPDSEDSTTEPTNSEAAQ